MSHIPPTLAEPSDQQPPSLAQWFPGRIQETLSQWIPSRPHAIDYVESEPIAEDMYPDIADRIFPLAKACAKTLSHYRHLCETNTIFDGYILSDGQLEVMLSPGLGIKIPDSEKQILFDNGCSIAKLLIDVMERRSK